MKTGRCLACGIEGDIDIHHVKTRGSGGTDDHWNLMPLDRKCHQRVHQLGLDRFAKEFKTVRCWLLAKGWTYEGNFKRWRRYELS